MRGPALQVTVWNTDGVEVVRCRGEVDLATIEEFQSHLVAAVRRGRAFVLDMRDVPYIDIRGVEALAQAGEQVRANGRRFIIASPSAALRRIIEILEAGPQFELAETVDEALGRLCEAAR
jgi:anti-anti-sigma factor